MRLIRWLFLVLITTMSLPSSLSFAQAVQVRVVANDSGALFLIQASTAWPLEPGHIIQQAFATRSLGDEIHGTLPAPQATDPAPAISLSDDGTLYFIEGSTIYPVVPDAISADDLAALSQGPQVGAIIPRVLWGQTVAPSPLASGRVTTCADLVTPDRSLAQTVPDLDASGSADGPTLCLMSYPAEDVYTGVIISLESVDQFDADKARAIASLQQLGVDACKIVRWQAFGDTPVRLNGDQDRNLPVDCPPHLEAGDPGAQPLLPDLQRIFSEIVDLTVAQTGWRPIRPLIVKVYTDVNVAVPSINTYLASANQGETVASLTERTRQGGSWYSDDDPAFGSLILLNLTEPGGQALASRRFKIADMYSAYAESGLAGGVRGQDITDAWFQLGLESYQAERNAGAARGYLGMAELGQRQGTETTPLAVLTTDRSWLAHQRSASNLDAIPARSHAAIVYLAERYGIDSLFDLLRHNHNGTLDQFESLLASMTGQDMPALDQSFSTWLISTTNASARGGNAFHVDATLSSGRSTAELRVTFDRSVPCGNGKQVQQGTTATLPIAVGQSGAFNGRGNIGDGSVAVQGTLTDGVFLGTVQLTNPPTGCDTGAMKFG
jgi:hypothetical protein